MILLSQCNFVRHQWYYSKLDLLTQLFWVAKFKGNTEFAHRKWTREGEGYKVVITHLSSFPGLSAYFCEDHGTQLNQCRYQSGLWCMCSGLLPVAISQGCDPHPHIPLNKLFIRVCQGLTDVSSHQHQFLHTLHDLLSLSPAVCHSLLLSDNFITDLFLEFTFIPFALFCVKVISIIVESDDLPPSFPSP